MYAMSPFLYDLMLSNFGKVFDVPGGHGHGRLIPRWSAGFDVSSSQFVS